MSRIFWDGDGQRFYEQGLDRGVLYLPDGRAVAWNGLVAVEEDPQDDSEPIYYDGVKIRDYQKFSDWLGTLRAITYPDEFLECEGSVELANGLYVYDQDTTAFSLSYRTKVANDLEPEYGDRIHVVFNIQAVPDPKTFETISDDPAPAEFAWKISASPGDVLGARPTAHILVEPRYVSDHQLWDFEKILYGSDTVNPSLPDYVTMYEWIRDWESVVVTYNAADETLTFDIREYPEPDGPGQVYRWLDAEQTFVEIDNVSTVGYGTTADGDNNPDTYNINTTN